MRFIFKQRRKFLYSISPEEQIPIFKIIIAIGLYNKNKSLTEYAVKLLNWETTLWQRIEYESGGFTFTEKVNGKTQKFIISDSILNVSYSGAKIEQIKQEILEDFKNREQFMRRIEENCKLSKI